MLLIVNKGLKNEGVEKIINRLKHLSQPQGFIRGISIAKTNDGKRVSLEDAIEDYFYTFRRLLEEDLADFYTINISCPNVYGGENFAGPHRLTLLMDKLFTIQPKKPVYVKMPINCNWNEFLCPT